MSIQTRSQREKFSRLRQSLLRLAGDVRRAIQPFLSDRPTLQGSVYELKRRCGKSGCRCAKGHLHPQMVLSTKVEGKTKLRTLPRTLLVAVQRKARTYQELRRARKQLVELHKRMLRVMEEMEAIRREEMK